MPTALGASGLLCVTSCPLGTVFAYMGMLDNVAAFIASLRPHFVRSWCVECDVFVVNVAE